MHGHFPSFYLKVGREPDLDSEEELIEQAGPVVKKVLQSRAPLPGADNQDLQQNTLLTLSLRVRSIKKIGQEPIADLLRYAAKSAANAYKRAFKDAAKERHVESYDANERLSATLTASTISPQKVLEQRDQLRQFWQKASTELTPSQLTVYLLSKKFFNSLDLLLDFFDIVDVDGLARTLNIDIEKLEEIVAGQPPEDQHIAELLNVSEVRVRTLRSEVKKWLKHSNL